MDTLQMWTMFLMAWVYDGVYYIIRDIIIGWYMTDNAIPTLDTLNPINIAKGRPISLTGMNLFITFIVPMLVIYATSRIYHFKRKFVSF